MKLHFFGGLGAGLTALGLAISMYLTVLKILGHAIGERPLLFLGVLLIVVGVQLLTLGLLGQMLVMMRRDESGERLNLAHIERTVGSPGIPAVAGPVARSRISGVGSGREATEATLPG